MIYTCLILGVTVFMDLVVVLYLACAAVAVIAAELRLHRNRYVFPACRVVSYTPARRLQCQSCGHTYARELGACLCTWAR